MFFIELCYFFIDEIGQVKKKKKKKPIKSGAKTLLTNELPEHKGIFFHPLFKMHRSQI